MADKGGALALLLKMHPKGGSMGDSAGDDEASEPAPDMEKLKTLAEQAFPDEDWSDERLQALHEFVKACYESEEGG